MNGSDEDTLNRYTWSGVIFFRKLHYTSAAFNLDNFLLIPDSRIKLWRSGMHQTEIPIPEFGDELALTRFYYLPY